MEQLTLKVKAINKSSNKTDDKNTAIPEGYDYASLNDSAVFYNRSYKQVFRERRADASRRRKRLSIVQIRYGKNRIDRKYLTDNQIPGITSDVVGLSISSIRELSPGSNGEIVGKEVIVKKGSTFLYYWNHPFHATRVFPSALVFLPS